MSDFQATVARERKSERAPSPSSHPASRAAAGAALALAEPDQRIVANEIWRQLARLATIGIFLIMFGVLLDLARFVLLPIASAVVIGTMLGPLARIAANHRIPPWLFATAVIGALVAVLQLATVLIYSPIIEWIGRAPEFTETLKAKLIIFDQGLAVFRDLQGALTKGGGDTGLHVDVTSMVQPTLAFLSPAVGELLLFFATLFFYLLDRVDLRKNLILVFDDQDKRLRAIRTLNDIEQNLTRYIGTVTVINLAIGVITAIGTWLIGFKDPVLLGALAFLFNYIPYVGPAVLVVILFGVGLISFPSLGYAALAPSLFIGLTTIEGHFVTPKIVGMRLSLNPLAVFLCLSCWTWLWGPVGAFLSVPFLIAGLVISNHLVDKPETELPG
jgi:predicted PurR-regulated permease PerM